MPHFWRNALERVSEASDFSQALRMALSPSFTQADTNAVAESLCSGEEGAGRDGNAALSSPFEKEQRVNVALELDPQYASSHRFTDTPHSREVLCDYILRRTDAGLEAPS